jgi:di/tricarboxylate transporter
VIAVHRNGERIRAKIGDIVLEPGDNALVQPPGFLRAPQQPDFYLVSELPGTENPRYDRAWVALFVLGALVAVVTLGWLPISIASFLTAGALVATRCITAAQARRSIEWSILIVIAAALGIGLAMEKTGVAAATAESAHACGRRRRCDRRARAGLLRDGAPDRGDQATTRPPR